MFWPDFCELEEEEEERNFLSSMMMWPRDDNNSVRSVDGGDAEDTSLI